MASRKEVLTEQLEIINIQISQLRKDTSKSKKTDKEKSRLIKLMTELIIELDSLNEPEISDK
jgi:hypothetical protein